MANQLKNAERAALLALMGAGGEMSNNELATTAGFRIDGALRRRLNELLLLTSDRRQGNAPFVHTLTRSGWSWCAEELLADLPEKPGPLGGALYVVLRGLNDGLERRKLSLLDFLSAGTTGEPRDIEGDIRAAYRKLATRPRAWVHLSDLRPLLNGADRDEVDEVLRSMSRARRANLVPDSNLKTLTDADHAAAVRIGRQENHLIAIEQS